MPSSYQIPMRVRVLPSEATFRLARNFTIAVIVLAGLAGCAGDMSDLQVYVDKVKAQKSTGIKPIPEIKPYESFQYPNHTKDPFDTAILAAAPPPTQARTGVQIDETRPREFLESFPLDTLRMVGTLEQQETVWALIRTPDGTIQRVTVGNYMGQNNGEIMQIFETSVTLKEYVPDGFGGYLEREGSIAVSE